MFTTTQLRILRHKHGISLKELECYCSFSAQYLSRLDLGQVKRTRKNEQALSEALEAIIVARKASALALEKSYQAVQGRLLQRMEVDSDEF